VNRVLLATFLIGIAGTVSASEFGINIYGISYHPDREDSQGNEFHEINPGAGIQWILTETKRNVWFLDGGLYRNSSAHAAEYFSFGYRYKLYRGIQIGAALALYHSKDQNQDEPFLAPLLLLSYRFRRVSIHLIPLPRYKDVNRNAAIGLYATIFIFN